MDITPCNISLDHSRSFRSDRIWGSQTVEQNFEVEQAHSEIFDVPATHHSSHEDHGDRYMDVDDEDPSPVLRARRTRSSASISQNGRAFVELRDIQARIFQLENQLTPSANDDGVKFPSNNVIAEDAPDPDTALDESVKGTFDQQEIIPEVVLKTWADFMNKDANQTAEHAIEILKGEPDYYHASKVKERSDRSSSKETADSSKRAPAPVKKPKNSAASSVPDRIRINSPLILSVLSNIDRHVDPTGSAVMLRPFKLLVFHEERIKDVVQRLEYQAEEQWQTEEERKARQLTLQHIRCLTDFMDKFLFPHIRHVRDSSTAKIAFRDLWYIFPPGEDIFMPLKRLRGTVFRETMDVTPDTFLRRYNMLWRVTGTGGGRPNISRSQGHDPKIKSNPFKVNCYYLDFDGKFFLPTTHTFAILPYGGEREITSLDFFPIRYMKDSQARLKEHTVKGGDAFRTIITGFKHFYYSGLTMVTQPCGCALQKEDLHQEFVESEVIVDFKVTLLRHPSWRPKPTLWKNPPKHEDELQEKFPVRYVTDAKRKKVARTEHDYVHDDHHIDKELAKAFRDNEPIFAPIPSGWASNAEMVPDKDVGLLAGRAFAFVLRTRSFAPLWLWALSPIKKQRESLNNLQLRDNGFKDTIQKLVDAHFKQSQLSTNVDYDIIHGKGRGLVILLHGAPGVGKTSTAESVAAASGKPLFQITSADLGMDPMSVEKALKEIFRYAQIWNCVLLLDECDVFLAQRSKNDILRNGLVSVFLRTLEFYTGVLFLTTNRVGVLDEAIKSRLTYTAYYPPLNGVQTRDIWKVNLRLLKERNKNLDVNDEEILDFARKHFRANQATNSTWNGRQIQNAFKVASALADWDDSVDESFNAGHEQHVNGNHRRPQLLPTHFEVIAEGTRAFDLYLQEATGYTDEERAYQEMVRAHDHDFDPQPPQVHDAQTYSNLPDEYVRQMQSASPARKASNSGFLPIQQVDSNQSQSYISTQAAGRRRPSVKWQQTSESMYCVPQASTQPRYRRASSSFTGNHLAPEGMAHSPRRSPYAMLHRNGSDHQSPPDLNTPSPEPGDDAFGSPAPDGYTSTGVGANRLERRDLEEW